MLESLNQPVVSEGSKPSKEEVREVITASVRDAVSSSKGKVGMLLSGGVDSTVLLKFVLEHGRIPVFTVVTDLSHPDLEAAKEVAKTYGLEHYVLMPSKEDLDRAYTAMKSRGDLFPGDAAVYLALELAKEKGVDTILSADGIDEMTGGYWWHANVGEKFPSKEAAFEHFWTRLESDHITPLLDSARQVGIEVKFPFLDNRVVSTLNRIPLEERVRGGVTKGWWKDFARDYISSEITDRPKLGFVSALSEDITSESPKSIWWETDYQESEEHVRRPRRLKGTRPSTVTSREVRL